MGLHSKPKPVVISGFSSQPLAANIATHMHSRLIKVDYKQHTDGEIEPTVLGNVRGHDVVLIASASGDPNKQIFETQLLRDTAKRAGATNITLVIPYMWYGRSDASWGERKTPALTSVIKNLRENCDTVLVADPHNPVLTNEVFQAGNTNGMVIPFAYPFALKLREMFNEKAIEKNKLLFLHPDAGSVKRIGPTFRDCLQHTLGIEGNPNKDTWPQIGKDRDKQTNESTTKAITVDVRGLDVVVFEDMIASGGTACDLAAALKDAGADSVTLFATSGLFTHKPRAMLAPIKRINESALDRVFITNTYDHSLTEPSMHRAIQRSPVIKTIDVSRYLAAIIDAIHMEVLNDTPENANSVSSIIRGRHSSQNGQVVLASKTRTPPAPRLQAG